MGRCDTDEKLEWLYFSFAARVRFTSTYQREGGGSSKVLELKVSWQFPQNIKDLRSTNSH